MTKDNVSGVYDLLFPSPLPLKNTIAISLAVASWREEINKYRTKNALNKLYLGKELPLDSLISYLPSTTLDLIRKYSKHFGSSIQHWLECHYRFAFKFDHNNHNEVLRDFDDFVGDFDGSIDFCKTAKRIMLCDRFSDLEKFFIACEYCLENDAAKYWPSVQSRVNLAEFEHISFTTFKWCLSYWILHFCFKSRNLGTVYGKEVLMHMNINTAATVDYFWDKIDATTRVEAAIQLFNCLHAGKSCRFVLPKLSENELDQLMLATGDELIPALLDFPLWIPFVIPVWRLVRSRITESNFLCIIQQMIKKQSNYQPNVGYDTTGCHEIWTTAPDNWKRLAIQNVLSDSSVFARNNEYYSTCRQTDLLFMLLSETPIEERNSFWNNNWSTLIVGTSTKDLDYVIKLCIADPNEIDQFKETVLSNYENIAPCCVDFLARRDFQKLNEFLIFCCHEEELRKDIKSRLLYEHFKFSYEYEMNSRLFDEFIKSAFEDEDQIIDFKHYLSGTMAGNEIFLWNIKPRNYHLVMEIVDTVVLSEEVAVNLKERVFPNVIWCSLFGKSPYISQFKAEEMSNFLQWCFIGDDEKIARFKLSLPIEEIVRAIINKARAEYKPDKRKNRNFDENSDLDEFLIWYFNTPEAVAEFKTRLPDVFEGIDLLNYLYL